MAARLFLPCLWLGVVLELCPAPKPAQGQVLPAPPPPPPTETGASPLLDVLSLVRPNTPRVMLGPATFRMGSTLEEAQRAHAECASEVHGALCTLDDFTNETPTRTVELSAFALDRFEVTVRQYQHCVRAQRCEPAPYYKGARRFEKPEHPVSLVTWDDARDYCRFVGAHLPTEAQWEYAARGTGGRRYPWGNAYNPRRSNHGQLRWDETDGSDGFVELAPVGSFPSGRTPDGVYDLAGNVEEWTWDRYDVEYDPTDLKDPVGAKGGAESLRSVRGGSYTSPRVRLRGSSRTGQWPQTRDVTRGFRCAVSSRAAEPSLGVDSKAE